MPYKDDKSKQSSSRKRDVVKDRVTGLLRSRSPSYEKGEAGSSDFELESDKEPFKLDDILLTIPRGTYCICRIASSCETSVDRTLGSLVCIVGRVGSGKSTLLTGLIGETARNAYSTLEFGGRVAYGGLSNLGVALCVLG